MDPLPLEVAPKDWLLAVVVPLRDQKAQLEALPPAVRPGAKTPLPLA